MDILLSINTDMMLASLKMLVILGCVTWFVSLIIEDVSIVDYIWSLLTLLAVSTYAYLTGVDHPISLVMLLMVAIWAIRLTWFLVKRGRNKPEDRRYQVIRERNSPNFGYKSLYLIFIFQALVAWVLSTLFVPVFESGADPSTPAVWSLWHLLGVIVWIFGFVYETVADQQLHYFNSRVVKEGSTLSSGLWRYCRHPNYFGEFCIWWAWFIYAIPTGSAWILVAPLIMTYLLIKFSGVGNMEQGITTRRPDYQAYIDSTNTFFPGKPHRKVIDS
jgi:steroid 5-alpha reductase family enzyme